MSDYPTRLAGADPTTRMMRYDAAKKSVGVAYLLWFFVGTLGVHRFYLGEWGIGLLMLACTILAFVTFGISGLVTGVLLIIDLFTIPVRSRATTNG